ILERYLLPLSQTKVTTRLGVFWARQYLRAPVSSVPEDEPARIASFRNSSRAALKLSASLTMKASETRDKSQLGGTKSSRMPSTSQEPASVILPVCTSGARTEPLGSARTILVEGETRRM